MKIETKNCQNCKQKFIINEEDFNFYEKMERIERCFSFAMSF